MSKTCGTCQHGRFAFTATGRFKKNEPGRCQIARTHWEQRFAQALPISIRRGQDMTTSVWSDLDADCCAFYQPPLPVLEQRKDVKQIYCREHMSANTIAALYVETDGCYFGLAGVDPWDKARDARQYAGPHPVVAHPPCQRWGALGVVNFARWGGLHNMPGNDGGTFATALHAVKLWGGVLEHPAKSRAFRHFGLTEPKGTGWQRCASGGWVCEVWQSAYGHRAAKATWLCYHGDAPPPELRWERPAGTHQVGFQDRRGKARNKPTLNSKEAAATPVEFRDLLINLARGARLALAA